MSVTSFDEIEKRRYKEAEAFLKDSLRRELESSGYTHLYDDICKAYDRSTAEFNTPQFGVIKARGDGFVGIATTLSMTKFGKIGISVISPTVRTVGRDEAPLVTYVIEQKSDGSLVEELAGDSIDVILDSFTEEQRRNEWPISAFAFLSVVTYYSRAKWRLQSIAHNQPVEQFEHKGIRKLFRGRPVTHVVFNSGLKTADIFFDKVACHEDYETYCNNRDDFYLRG